MIKDYELIKNEEFIHMKKFIIWGTGKGGRELLAKLQVETDQIEFIDSDKSKVGECQGKCVYGPERLLEYSEEDDIAIVISALSVELQEEIAEQIKRMGGDTHDVYTKFAVEIALCMLEEKKIKLQDKNQEMKSLHDKLEVQMTKTGKMERCLRLLGQVFSAGMTEKEVLVYQSGKVGSLTVVQSLLDIGIYPVHIHNLRDMDSFISLECMRNFINKKHIKVISLVRDPIARQFSLLWHALNYNTEMMVSRYGTFDKMEEAFLTVPGRRDEFEWYRKEMETVLGINIYEHPFDRNAGYSIIEKDGISVLLMKLEKITSLENVIARFLEVGNFKLHNTNEASKQAYRFAYKDYLRQVKVPKELQEYYYNKNRYMNYFYTEKEIQQFRERWQIDIGDVADRNIVGNRE